MDYFKIIKSTAGIWFHEFLNQTSRVHISDFEVVIDAIKNTFVIEAKNGSNVPSQAVSLSLVQVIDESVSPNPIHYADAQALILLLTQKYYTPYLINANSTSLIKVWTKGDRIAITRDQTFINVNFDATTGVGINEMIGWKKSLQNANRVSVCQGAEFPTMGNTGGNTNITLTRPQLPAGNIGWIGDDGAGFPDGSADSTTPGTDRSYVRKTKQLALGNGNPIDIRQKFIVELHIERTVDLWLVGAQYVLPFGQNEIDAILSANAPSLSNPFATIADITGGVTDTPNFLIPVRIRKGILNTNPATKSQNEAGDYFEYGFTDSGSGESFLVVGKLNVTNPTDITDLSNFTHLSTVGA